ncbi:allantoate amidohydrolase [Nocardioides massiliensis]|uniref:N-carbamoyl-L-amino-acid hydrolase n=1 Tax=Nocardioides massiliensis TaxID=1325935 RepID=A0ABT9NM72_9ACTN|nr:allantoate amidohydrolase [Nocardioides massiliensis]MDP9821515.1 N-carbamoyl-L-amino-acid hydrolase [Nocardioides massiliensis]
MSAHPTFEQMWAELAPIGRSATTGGYFRQPYTAAELECRAWFTEQAVRRGLRTEVDGNGTLLAWWQPEGAAGPAVLTGSHLDSVVDGGAYDGPLGVVSAFAALDRLVADGLAPARPLVVAAFPEEEGSRFGVACLGSRLATGVLSGDDAARLQDADGTSLLDAMASAGVAPDLGPAAWLSEIGVYVELHIEQGRDLVHRDAAVGLGSGIWPHGRYRFDFTGEANHAGTTHMEDRRDPMLTYAMTALAANKQARLSGNRATFGRVAVEPNGTNAVPSRVSAWLDARAEDETALSTLVTGLSRQATERAERDRTGLQITAESVSGAVAFDEGLTSRLATHEGREPWPVIPTAAGHDAGILSTAGIPTAMLFVRNPTGISHSPAEHASTQDCLAGVDALIEVLERLLTAPADGSP